MRDLGSIIKAYDVRGVYPDQLDEDLAHDVGAAFVRVCGIADAEGAVVIGHDMRPSGPDLVASFAEGVREQGCDVVLIGLASTDGLYYASGALGLPGAMFTASHNPAKYNGIKLCRAGAAPVGQDSGLRDIRALIDSGIPAGMGRIGEVTQRDVLTDYALDTEADPRRILDFEADVAALTAAEIQRIAADILRDDQYIQVVLYPEAMEGSGD